MIKAIFLVEFEYEEGPVITFFHPTQSKFEEMVTQMFKEFNFFICPEDDLCEKLLCLNQNDKYISIGWPHQIKNKDYKRSKIIYNTNFVIKKKNLKLYENSLERLLKKLALFLAEVEGQYNQFSNSSNRYCLQAVLNNLYRDLNNKSECIVRIEKNFIYLNLVPSDQSQSLDIDQAKYLIPVMAKKVDSLIPDIEGRDVMLTKIFKYINAKNTCEKIMENILQELTCFCPNEVNLDKLIMQKLISLEHTSQIFFTDIFSLKNVYMINYNQFLKCKDNIDILFMDFLNKLKPAKENAKREKMTEPVVAKNVQCKFFLNFDGHKPQSEVRDIFYDVFDNYIKFAWCFGHYLKLFKRLYEYPNIQSHNIDILTQEKLSFSRKFFTNDLLSGKEILEKFDGSLNKDQIIDQLKNRTEQGYYKILNEIESSLKKNKMQKLIVYYKPNT